MSLLGNIVWLIFGGFFTAVGFFILGCLWCLSVVGIPIGLQCFKFARLTLSPFGKEVSFEGGMGSILLNVVWWFLGGFAMAVGCVAFGLLLCVTIVGIPFGLQFFKIAKLALLPLGARIRFK